MKLVWRSDGVIAGLVILLFIISAVFAPFIAPYDPNSNNTAAAFQGISREHPMGADYLGRDMLSRIIWGGRASMLLALTATVLSMLAGLILGVISGYYGGWADWLITAVANIFQGLPGTSLMVAIVGVLGPSAKSLILGLVLTSWAGFSRIIRTETLRLREEPFIEGLRCLGCGNLRMLAFHIIPNLKNNTIILFTSRVGRSLLSMAALSFLGLGVQPPDADWSVMISDARMYYRSAPHLIIAPGLCILILLFAINTLGDYLRDMADERGEEGG